MGNLEQPADLQVLDVFLGCLCVMNLERAISTGFEKGPGQGVFLGTVGAPEVSILAQAVCVQSVNKDHALFAKGAEEASLDGGGLQGVDDDHGSADRVRGVRLQHVRQVDDVGIVAAPDKIEEVIANGSALDIGLAPEVAEALQHGAAGDTPGRASPRVVVQAQGVSFAVHPGGGDKGVAGAGRRAGQLHQHGRLQRHGPGLAAHARDDRRPRVGDGRAAHLTGVGRGGIVIVVVVVGGGGGVVVGGIAQVFVLGEPFGVGKVGLDDAVRQAHAPDGVAQFLGQVQEASKRRCHVDALAGSGVNTCLSTLREYLSKYAPARTRSRRESGRPY